MNPAIMLTGANGFVGNILTRSLLAAGQAVKPVSRREGIDFAGMLTPAQWRDHLAGIDAVINCVGIIGETGRQRFDHVHHLAPKALFQACAEVGVRRVVQISALGADERARTHYHLSKRAADESLMRLDLDWFVLRPSLIYGPGGQSTRLFMKLARLPWLPCSPASPPRRSGRGRRRRAGWPARWRAFRNSWSGAALPSAART